jgi:putative nucleotidyltransferase with HDIG domain
LRRILFVDDEQHILDGLEDLLRKYRHQLEMVFATSGAEALEELAKAPFDVIVSDMRMSRMDGAMLLQKVKQEYPGVVRIVLSGHADRDAIFMALPVAHQFLAKPCDTDYLKNVIEQACRLRGLLHDESLRQPIGGIEKLPSLPVMYHQLMAAMANPETSAQMIARIIEQDPAMSAKVLQLANSACFGSSRSIGRIQQAVVHLGMELIKNLSLTVHIFSGSGKRPASSMYREHQAHALLAARVAAKLLPDRQQSQLAFTAALLHDIGKIVLGECIPDRYAGVLLESCRATGRPVHEVELELLGVTHAEVGAYLLGLWGLPNPIVEAVAHHHNPAGSSEKSFGILAAVHIANALVHEGRGGESRIDEAWLESLGVLSELSRWKEIVEGELELAAPAAHRSRFRIVG